MTAEFGPVKTALYDALRGIPALNVYRDPPDQILIPAAVIRPSPAGFITNATMDGANDYAFSVLLLTGAADDYHAKQALDDYLDEGSPSSIVTTVQDSAALQAVADDVTVTPSNEWGYHEITGVLYYGSPFNVEISA
jgi:hypothetical protein